MIQRVRIATASREGELSEVGLPLDLDRWVPGEGDWEVELGFGKGRYLLERAAREPGRRFLGVEVAAKYFRLVRDRVRRRELSNVVLLRGEAALILATVLPRELASVVHVYFPDPWPKARHHRRRLFDPGSVDLLAGLLRPGASLCVATDHPEYGPVIEEALASYPGLEIGPRDTPWEDGPRTHYEAKYEAEGRPILRLEGRRIGPAELHPGGSADLLVAWAAE